MALTSFKEDSPNVIKEAMACNCPIVATDVGDVRTMLGNTKGCFITTFQTEDVADKLRKSIAFGKRTNAKDYIQHLDSNVIAKRIIKIYEEIIRKNY